MTPIVLIGGIIQTLFGLVLFFTALFLILLILVQRGRGGGLSGAFGGMGGQSAFGSKAGDTFTFITIVVATFWILLCIAGVAFMKHAGSESPLDTRRVEETDTTTEEAPPAGEVPPAAESAPSTPQTPAPSSTTPADAPAQDGQPQGEGD